MTRGLPEAPKRDCNPPRAIVARPSGRRLDPVGMSGERPADQALETATKRLIDEQDSFDEAIEAGTPRKTDEANAVVRRAESVQSLADEAAHATDNGATPSD